MSKANFLIALQLLGGVGLLLYGVRIMSDGLQMVAGRRLRRVLEMMTSNRLVAVLVGVVATATVQSSTAITVTMVGFVNAGLISFAQALSLMLGAHIGTTITAQLIAFKLTDLAMPALFIGVSLLYFAKRKHLRHVGEVMIGFGLLFLGLLIMQSTLAPLSKNPEFIDFFTHFAADSYGGILLNVAAGALLCMCLHSSSVAVGITMVLASQGLLTLPGAVAMVLGDNIGTTITAEMAAIGSSLEARRAARANCLANILGVCYIMIFFYPFLELVQMVSGWMGVGPAEMAVGAEKPNIARHIANSHTLFNLVNTTVCAICLPLLIKMAVLCTPRGRQVSVHDLAQLQYIKPSSYRFEKSTSASLAEVRQELVRMGGIARDSFMQVTQIPLTRDLRQMEQWKEPEKALNSLQRQIIQYLVQVSQNPISDDESNEISLLMRVTNNLERMGDSVENLAHLNEQLLDQKLEFTENAREEYKQITELVAEFMQRTLAAMARQGELPLAEAKHYEDTIDEMRDRMREDHVNRLRNGQCTLDAGLIFVNMLTNYERIGDYLYNIALVQKDLRKIS